MEKLKEVNGLFMRMAIDRSNQEPPSEAWVSSTNYGTHPHQGPGPARPTKFYAADGSVIYDKPKRWRYELEEPKPKVIWREKLRRTPPKLSEPKQ